MNETYYRGCEGKDLRVGVRVRHVTRLLLFLMFESAYVEHAMYAYNATRQSLVIRSLNASYSGEWSVHVSNGHGIASANFTVNVTGHVISYACIYKYKFRSFSKLLLSCA